MLFVAVAAALGINAGYVVQHRGLATVPRVEPRRPLATVAALLRSPRWLAGAALGYAGLALEIVALTALPLSTVQATIGAGLVVVAVLARRLDGVPAGRAAALGALLAVAALGVLAVVTPPAPAYAPAPSPWALAAAAGIVAGAAWMAARRLRSAMGLALAAGLLYGVTGIAMAALAPLLAGAVPSLGVAAVALPTGALVTAAGFLSFQRALQHGRPLAVVTVMMGAMNVVAIAGGIVVLGDPLAAGAPARAAQLAALALAGLSAVVVLREPPPAQELPRLFGGGQVELRSRIGRVGARPAMASADQAQVGDRRAGAARAPVEP